MERDVEPVTYECRVEFLTYTHTWDVDVHDPKRAPSIDISPEGHLMFWTEPQIIAAPAGMWKMAASMEKKEPQ